MDGKAVYSQDSRLNKLLETVVDEVRLFAEGQIGHIQRLANIGIALSAEKDIHRLFEMIVDEAMQVTSADAGTLYIVDDENKVLRFEILKNKTLNTHMGGTSGVPITLPPVPLEVDGKLNYSNVSSHSALTGKIANIADVYEAVGFDFTGPKKYDRQTGYRSKSMLVVPMRNHDEDIIGVLQLLNAMDGTAVVPFSRDYVDLISALASQAAIALDNAHLIRGLRELFESFIKSIATAIDEKSPYTAGHIRRVTDLTMMIAETIMMT